MMNRTIQALRQITARRPRRLFSFLLVSLALLGAGLGVIALRRAAAGWAAPLQSTSGPRALVNRQITVNSGRIEGSVQQLTAENTTLNSDAVITGDLFVLGTPTVQRNGQAQLGSTVTGAGSAQPTTHRVTLNGQANLNRLVTRTNAVALPTVAPPPAAAGTRNVTLNQPTQSPGDFATIRDLTLNGNYGLLAVPSGTYRNFTANGGSGFILGTANATQPAVYNLNGLTLNGGSQLQVAGPVVLTIANSLTLNASMGTESNPNRLTLKIATGALTLNGGSALYGAVIAPNSTVTINGNSRLVGQLSCDRLTVQGNGLLRLDQADTTGPILTVKTPDEGAFTNAANINVTGTVSDASAVTVTVNNLAATVNGNSFTASVPLIEGANTLIIKATDAAGNQSQALRTITRDSLPPNLTVLSPKPTQIFGSLPIAVNGLVTDTFGVASLQVNGAPVVFDEGGDANGAFQTQLTMPAGNNLITVVATDRAGNVSSSSLTVVFDNAAPQININSPANGMLTKVPNIQISGSVTDNLGVANVIVNQRDALLTGGNFTANVPLVEGVNTISAVATDVSGKQTAASISVTLDTAFPVININAPAPGQTLRATPATVSGTVADASNIASLTVNGVPTVVAGGAFTASIPFNIGLNTINVNATDVAGNTGQATAQAVLDTAPRVSLSSPRNGDILNTQSVTVEGAVDVATAQVSVNGVNASVSGGRFTANNVPLLRDGTRIITAVGVGPDGSTGQDSLTVAVDTTPPTVTINSQPDGFTTTSDTLTVAGVVNDVITANPTLTVNGVNATVGNGAFLAVGVPLNLGANEVSAVARDEAGNTQTTTINVTRRAQQPGLRVVRQSGEGQHALAGTTLPADLSVQVVDARGNPIGNREVLFEVALGDGVISDAASAGLSARALYLRTDGNGLAAVRFTLGRRAGAGTNRVKASVNGSLSSAEFCATAESGAPNSLVVLPMGGLQTGVVNSPLPEPFAGVVLDARGNPVAGVPVTFQIAEGGGNFDGNPITIVNTGPDGVARARLTLGPEPGTQNNSVTATFAGPTGGAVEFGASARVAGPAAATTFYGLLLDNNDLPLRNAHISIPDSNASAFTDVAGRFNLSGVPPGSQRLLIGGATINDPQGRAYPDLEFDVNVISGVANTLQRPIQLPPLTTAADSMATITGPVGAPVVLHLPGVAEATLTLTPGTVVRNHNGPASPSNPITLRWSRVNNDRVPMPAPNGAAFDFAWTLQPSGTHFSPAAGVCLPNQGAAPGAQVDMFNFDHDQGRFVGMGPAVVSEDGSLLCTAPGFGIDKAGWGGAAPPPDPSNDAKNCRVTSVTANPAQVCVTTPAGGGAAMSEEVVITASVDPADKIVTWSGDLGSNPQISGNTVRTRYATPGEKEVKATCEQSSKTFKVKVSKISIEINNTPAQDDDITLFNAAAPTFTQTIQAKVTLQGPATTIQLEATPAGRATLSKTTLNLAANRNEVITITPTARSQAVNDVMVKAKLNGRECASEDMTIVSVTFPKIRNSNTPGAMPDRIPPRVDTRLEVLVEPTLGSSGQMVRLAVLNGNANNGNLTINGNATQDLTATANVDFRGTGQTVPGNAGNINIVAQVRGADTAQSAGFSIAAIVINYRQASATPLAGGVLRFTYTWQSDSGMLGDLDQVWIGEYVSYSDGGTHAGAGRPWHGNNPNPTITPPRTPGDATLGTFTDTHSPPGGLPLAGPMDSYNASQDYGFHDYRTDNTADNGTLGWQITVTPNITISRFVENTGTPAAPVWRYRITKSGSTNTAPLP